MCDKGETGVLCETNGTHCGSFTKGCVKHSDTLGNKGEQSGDLASIFILLRTIVAKANFPEVLTDFNHSMIYP